MGQIMFELYTLTTMKDYNNILEYRHEYIELIIASNQMKTRQPRPERHFPH